MYVQSNSYLSLHLLSWIHLVALNCFEDCRPKPACEMSFSGGMSFIILRATTVRMPTRFVCGCFL